jgi:allophanate hydrolase
MSTTSKYDGPISIGSLRAAYRSGVTPREVIAAVYARIEQHHDNPIWIDSVPQDGAMSRAEELERDSSAVARSQPLWGVPFAVKDNIDVAGLRTTAGCEEFAYSPTRNAAVIDRLIAAGAICIGKTNLDQFATGLVGTRSPYGICRNAFDPRFISGGSSSGSAVAVACEQVGFALGTDTAGSGRIPAAFNNIVGLKPTRGRISVRGVVPACRSLDCVSVFAHDCADAAEVLRVAAAYDSGDAFSRRSAALLPAVADNFRFAVPRQVQREFFGDGEYAQLYEQSIAQLQRIGGEPVEIDFGMFLEVQKMLYEGPWLAERIAAFGAFNDDHPGVLHPVLRHTLERGARFTAVEAFDASYRLLELRRQTEAIWAQVSLLLVPAAATIYRIDEVEADPVELNSRLGLYTNFVNLLDLAAINVPAGFRSDGLPFGVSLIAPAFADEALTQIGGRLHAALGIPTGALLRTLPAPAPSIRDAAASVRLAVVGAHMSGLALNSQLTERGARLVLRSRTAPRYRLYELPGGPVARPGLVRVRSGEVGGAIEVEVWEVPVAQLGSFLGDVPAPLGIGTLELQSGEQVKGFVCESYAADGATDITAWGGWRAWIARGESASESI